MWNIDARGGTLFVMQFAGFSASALKDRIVGCECKVLITSDGAYRGTKFIPLKAICDEGESSSHMFIYIYV